MLRLIGSIVNNTAVLVLHEYHERAPLVAVVTYVHHCM